MKQQMVRTFVPKPPEFSCRGEAMLEQFFTAPKLTSFREAYVSITGDSRVTGRLENCNLDRMREALGTSDWPSILGAAVARRMVAEYQKGYQHSMWRKIANVVPASDFRTQRSVRYGGYGDLPTVAEGAGYLALPSPDDEEATWSVEKRGGTETITLELVKNDDIQAIRALPKRLAEAAHRTLAHFVLNMLRDNPVIYDGVELFHAAHANLGAAALSASALNAGRAAMMKQLEPGSGDPLGTEPAFLWVPFDLEETAQNLFRRGTNQDKSFIQSMNVEVVPVWYWGDENDWCLSANPDVLTSIEVGFLDGADEPALFVQSAPSAGSLFSNDQITLKIRHIYGGAVKDYRGLYKSVVAA